MNLLITIVSLKQRGVRTINRYRTNKDLIFVSLTPCRVKQIRQHNPRRAMDVKRLNQYASSIGK
jgi:hypothetical protein